MLHRRVAAVLAAFAVAVVLWVSSAAVAAAQTPPMLVYGMDVPPGAAVAALIGGVVCASTTADSQGQWIIRIEPNAPCSPEPGDTIAFTLDGEPTDAIETFRLGGAPENVAQGVALTAKGVTTPTPTPAAKGTPLPEATQSALPTATPESREGTTPTPAGPAREEADDGALALGFGAGQWVALLVVLTLIAVGAVAAMRFVAKQRSR
jgi:hypothetical protein